MNTETVNPTTFHRTEASPFCVKSGAPLIVQRETPRPARHCPCRVPTVGNPTVLKTTGMRQNLNTWGGTSLSAVLGCQKTKKHHFTTWRLKTTGSWKKSPHLGMKQHIFQCLVDSNMLNGTYTRSFCTVCARHVGMYGPKEIEQIDCIFSSNKFVRDTYI